jgi:hypothetical protein
MWLITLPAVGTGFSPLLAAADYEYVVLLVGVLGTIMPFRRAVVSRSAFSGKCVEGQQQTAAPFVKIAVVLL